MPTDTQRKILRSLKGIQTGTTIETIPICDDSGAVTGSLRPIDIALTENVEVATLMAKWRNRFNHYFLTQFVATPTTTLAWLKNVVIREDDRIQFLILETDGRPIGFCGVRDITEGSAEFAWLVRGESGGGPNLIFFAEIALLRWLYKVLNVQLISLQVFSNNPLPIMLHQSVGFANLGTYRLYKSVEKDQIRYTVDKENAPSPGEFGLMEMQLTRESFFSKFPWAA